MLLKTNVLLIEDNPSDAELIQATLGMTRVIDEFEITLAERLSQGLEKLSVEKFDMILLDLGLPDSQGLETLQRVIDLSSGVPIVVLTGLVDEEVGLNAVTQGAQDYLIKNDISSETLNRVIKYAISRKAAQEQLKRQRELEDRLTEMRSLDALAEPSNTSVTARIFGVRTIREVSEDLFHELCEKYDQLLEQAIDQRTYRVENTLSEKLRALSMEVGMLRGGPRDVIEIHTAVLNDKIKNATFDRSHAYLVEGRLAVLELMGDLVTYYRAHSILDSKR